MKSKIVFGDQVIPVDSPEVTVIYDDIHSDAYDRHLTIDDQGVKVCVVHKETGRTVRTASYPHQDLLYEDVAEKA